MRLRRVKLQSAAKSWRTPFLHGRSLLRRVSHRRATNLGAGRAESVVWHLEGAGRRLNTDAAVDGAAAAGGGSSGGAEDDDTKLKCTKAEPNLDLHVLGRRSFGGFNRAVEAAWDAVANKGKAKKRSRLDEVAIDDQEMAAALGGFRKQGGGGSGGGGRKGASPSSPAGTTGSSGGGGGGAVGASGGKTKKKRKR